MHTPAMDSLRQERVGLVRDGEAAMILQAYMKTKETEEEGAYDPIERMSRPFPYLLHTGCEALVVEEMVDEATLEPLSDTILEHASTLYEAMRDEKRVDEVDLLSDDAFEDSIEVKLANSLFTFATHEVPMGLFRTVYERAHWITHGPEGTSLITDSLRDIRGQDRYEFAYLPSLSEVDNFEILWSSTDGENEDGEYFLSESLWVRYPDGDSHEERPLLAYQNDTIGFTALSPNVEYGTEEMTKVDEEFVENILTGENEETQLAEATIPEDTRTHSFLTNYEGESRDSA